MIVSTILKDYGEHKKYLVYSKPFIANGRPPCNIHLQVNCDICTPRHSCRLKSCEICSNKPISLSSIIRTKSIISDYVLSNDFQWFCTFTYDPKKVDSMNVEISAKKMQNWLSNVKKDIKGMKYLIVAEKHKSGAIHYHALMTSLEPILRAAGRKHKGRDVYNIKRWRYGFSTAIKIDNRHAVAAYVQKYITKDMLKISNKKRYWASRNLEKPEKTYNIGMDLYMRRILELQLRYQNDKFKIYTTIDRKREAM